jgi:L-alanine-DL-glutamate epimerase-like enolase superfamily enzyme
VIRTDAPDPAEPGAPLAGHGFVFTIGAVANACWDPAARRAGKPLWLLLAEMEPEELVRLVDFLRHARVVTGSHARAARPALLLYGGQA